MILVRRKKFPGPQYDVAEIVRKQLRHGKMYRPLDRMKQTKMFIRAKLGGASTQEAKDMSGMATASLKQIMDTPMAQKVVEELCREEEFKDSGLVKRLKEMWHKKKIRAVKVSGPSMVDSVQVEEDDTDMWKYSMDKVLNLRGYLKNGKDGNDPAVIDASGGINFNVLQVPSE